MTSEPDEIVAEERQSLWMLIISPTIWAAHFLISYTGAAIWCGMVEERSEGAGLLRAAIIGLAALALIGIAITGSRGWRRHTYGGADPPYDKDTPEDRHRFLGFATVLLSALSGVAVLYAVIATLFIRTCE